jgi:hypothetical protein
MHPIQEEFANPGRWLTRLAEETDGYRRLVRESGGNARAAYRLARARCSATPGREPCLEDLQAAAQLLATKLGSSGALPIQSLLPSAKSAPPEAKSAPPAAKSAPPNVKAALKPKSSPPHVSSAPPAPSSPERRAANKIRARQSAPTL